MIVYINENGYIVDIGTTERHDVTRREINDDFFKDKCDDFIKGYKIEIVYETEIVDGEEVPVLDEYGNKIEIGQSIYPYIDYTQLLLIQQRYDMEQFMLLVADVIGGMGND